MDGDKVDDQGSVYIGKRKKNGWKNSGSPWTGEVYPELTGYQALRGDILFDVVLHQP